MGAKMSLEQWLEPNGGVDVHFGKTSYVARITGEHDKYGLDREFISSKIDSSYSGKTGTLAVAVEEIAVGEIYEIRGDSWGKRHRQFVRVVEIEHSEDRVGLTTELLKNEQEVLDSLAELDVESGKLRREIKTLVDIATSDQLEEVYTYLVEEG